MGFKLPHLSMSDTTSHVKYKAIPENLLQDAFKIWKRRSIVDSRQAMPSYDCVHFVLCLLQRIGIEDHGLNEGVDRRYCLSSPYISIDSPQKSMRCLTVSSPAIKYMLIEMT